MKPTILTQSLPTYIKSTVRPWTRDHRLPGLPSYNQIAEEAKQALFQIRDTDERIQALQELKQKVTESFEDHDMKQPFLRWRGVLEAMLREYVARIAESRADESTWGQ